MVTLVATGTATGGEHGKVVITATTLPRQADPLPEPVSEWERGRRAFFTALLNEGMAFEPAIEDDYSWIRTGC